ncbi:MAG: FlxA-like family protein [Candidatus Binataceae bacterium]|nr:FlxA-like family protein [Candidatus Binataceae bacterium]
MARVVSAADSGDSALLIQIKQEIDQLKADREKDRQQIQHLEQQIQAIQKQPAQAPPNQPSATQQATDQQLKALAAKVAAQSSPQSFAQEVNDYLGRYRFTIVGGAAGGFIYDRQSNINTYNLDLEPILLWQISDRMLFEATIEASLPSGGAADYELPVATLQYFLNDYMEVVAGIFDQPFGDWYEDQSPFWVNRFITAPLPYGANALVPGSDIGLQLRGAYQWGAVGQIADYTVWSGNGPGYNQATCTGNTSPSPLPSCSTRALVGDTLVGVNNIRLNTHTPAFGARIRVYPLPVESELGRLEVGASTYDGKWLNGLWLKSWGADFNYFKGNLQTRGEWIQSYRQMPGSIGADNRQGWYVQAGYFLAGVRPPLMPSSWAAILDKFEPLIRYSGVNQRASVLSDISTTPGIGFNGSPAVFAPHAREVALGLDYWFAPSVVWQNEFNFEMPGAGGFYSDTGARVGAVPNDRAFLSQFAIGF